MNSEACTLLRCIIERTASLDEAVRAGDCNAIALMLNGWMPPGMQLTPADIAQALPGGQRPTRNAQVLRARIDAIPVLYSARINGDAQCILNELHIIGDGVSLADVQAALAVQALPRPSFVVQGSASLFGASRIG